jgi:hypothetical protein
MRSHQPSGLALTQNPLAFFEYLLCTRHLHRCPLASSQEPWEVDGFIPMLQIRKLRLREG